MSDWNGARWWKCDFHTHTPASHDYGKGPDQNSLKEISPRDWLISHMKAGVDCVAITDHNSGAWIERVRAELDDLDLERPEGYRPLFVFPGVEISVHGRIHLLAILGCEKTTEDINYLLRAAGFPPEAIGTSDRETTKSFVEVVEAITAANGIAVPAHVDRRNRVFEELHGTTLEQILNCSDIFAMELVDPAFVKPQLYVDKNLYWTEILGSDAHHPSGDSDDRYPGSDFTWVKMGSPCIEGLRLALLDGALSVRRSDENVEDPNKHSPLILESIEVSQARYMGRRESFFIGFNPWFNAIIGGRGTGKSSAVEFLRIALRRNDELRGDALRAEFEQYNQIYTDRNDVGLLTNNATIRVICLKDEERFRVQWNPSGGLNPIEREVDSDWELAEGEVSQRFPVRMYSQKQVFHLAKSPDALLKIIDEAPEVEFRARSEERKLEETRFLTLRAKAREIEAGLGEEQRFLGELDDVTRKLEIFEQSGHAEILKTFQVRSRQKRDVTAWEEDWKDVGERLKVIAAEIVPDQLDITTSNPDESSDSDIHELADKVHEQLTEIRASVESLAFRADEILAKWREECKASSWSQSVEAAANAYQQLRENLEKEGAGDPATYGELVQLRQVIEQRLKLLDEDKGQIINLMDQSQEILKRLQEIRRNLTASRKSFLDRVLKDNQYVRIRMVSYGARETVEEQLRQLIQKEDSSFGNDIGMPDGGGLLGELYDTDSTIAFERNLERIKTYIRMIASGEYSRTTLADQRFATHLSRLPPEVFDRLDLWFPDDSLHVQYSADGDGQNFQSIQEGSPGQKTAALLAFLLSYGEEPLILDQPEDDLDNHLIYDLIVTQLREVKRSRQVIVVTHNANIVVNGDAELVVALAARGGETQIECEGSLQKQRVRDTICDIMEGGRKAFEDRYRRILLEGRND